MDNRVAIAGGIFGAALGAGTLFYTYVDGERANVREQDLGFSQFAAQISRLEADLEHLDEEFILKQKEIADLRQAIGTLGGSDTADIAKLEARITVLESRKSRPANTVTADVVAAILLRDHLTDIQGPKGDPGAKGDKGEPGEQGQGSANAANPRAPIKVATDYQSTFEDRYWGNVRVSLIGCSGRGQKVSCTFLVFPEADVTIGVASRSARVALPSAEWVKGYSFTAAGKDVDNDWVSLSKGIPTKFEMSFKLPSGGHEGLLALEVYEQASGTKAEWRDIPLVN